MAQGLVFVWIVLLEVTLGALLLPAAHTALKAGTRPAAACRSALGVLRVSSWILLVDELRAEIALLAAGRMRYVH